MTPLTDTNLKNSDLLGYQPDALLLPLDKQRRYLVRIDAVRKPCPSCGHAFNVFEGLGVDIDDYSYIGPEKTEREEACCPACSRPVKQVVPLMVMGDPWFWHLVPTPVRETA